ncbi:MAG: STAS domain-containing protein [Roseiflexaceae bacterium]
MVWFQQFLRLDSADEERRRQGVAVGIVALMMTLVALTLGGKAIYDRVPLEEGSFTIIGAPIYAGVLWLVRRGFIRVGAYLITWVPLTSLIALFTTTPTPVTGFFFAWPILLASIVLPSFHLLPIALVSLAASGYVLATNPDPVISTSYFALLFFVVVVCALAYLSAVSVERAFAITRAARHELEQANLSLVANNDALEDRVVQRTTDLQQALQIIQQREQQLQRTLEELGQSQATVNRLSAPVLPVAVGVLVAPLIGVVDTERAEILMNTLLQTTQQQQARFIILDVTGILMIDTQVANVILHATRSLRLIGARVILTGIRPEVAQTLVGLGIDLQEILVRSTLDAGIAEALQYRVAAR